MMIDIIKNTIKNFQDALEIRESLALFHPKGWHFLYRGHGTTIYKLIPSIARKKSINGNIRKSEIECLAEFISLIEEGELEKTRVPSYDQELYYMSVGRHLGLDCRLLDWTAKLETALYFASSDENNRAHDGHLWIMCYHGTIDETAAKESPFSVKEFTLVKEAVQIPENYLIRDLPEGVLRRVRQNGFFTVMPTEELYVPLNEKKFENICFLPIKILATAKSDILSNLPNDYGDYLHLTSCAALQKRVEQINFKYFE